MSVTDDEIIEAWNEIDRLRAENELLRAERDKFREQLGSYQAAECNDPRIWPAIIERDKLRAENELLKHNNLALRAENEKKQRRIDELIEERDIFARTLKKRDLELEAAEELARVRGERLVEFKRMLESWSMNKPVPGYVPHRMADWFNEDGSAK